MENSPDSYILSSYYRELGKLQAQQQQQQQQQQSKQPQQIMQQIQQQQQQQMLAQQNQNFYQNMSMNQNVNVTRTNGPTVMNNDDDSSKAENLCHGCGHSGHNRPSCPFKDIPGWVAKGKRTQPLDVYNNTGHPPVSTVGMCHGCGHFGHSRVVCPYRDLPGWFHYGQRRVPLDITSKPVINSNMDVCHGCGNPGHNRPQCPYKDLPGFIHRGQRRIPLDVNQAQSLMANGNNGSVTTSETMSSKANEGSDSPVTNRDGEINQSNQSYSQVAAIPLIPAICQSLMNQEPFNVNVMFDASKMPNIISKKLFDHICLSGDASISRKDINIQLHDRTLPLSYYTRLHLAFIDVNFEIEDEFYITESVYDIIVGFNMIFTYNLYSMFDGRFSVVNNTTNTNGTSVYVSSPSLMPDNDNSPKSNLINSNQSMSNGQQSMSNGQSNGNNNMMPSPQLMSIQSGNNNLMTMPSPSSNSYSKGNMHNFTESNLFIPTSIMTTTTISNNSNLLDNSHCDLNDSSLWYSTSNASGLTNHFNGFDLSSPESVLGFSHLNIAR